MSATLTTLVNFDLANVITDGAGPTGSLIFDSNGDLFGTTTSGGGHESSGAWSKSPRQLCE
jgi:hypothetical protein